MYTYSTFMYMLGSSKADHWPDRPHRTRSGTPYCSDSDTTVANESIRPEDGRAFFGHLDENLSRLPVLVPARRLRSDG
jgi:hypothetical protein